jgi:hypothetical protein
MGACIDNSVNDGRGPPLFKICGQVHHRIGSLLPIDGTSPQFLQLYIYDTANEVQNRLQCLTADNKPLETLDPSIASKSSTEVFEVPTRKPRYVCHYASPEPLNTGMGSGENIQCKTSS